MPGDLRHTTLRLLAKRERATESTGYVPANGIDSHSALTRFLGIPSDFFGDRLPDTAFTQYGGLVRANFNLESDTSCCSATRATSRTAASVMISCWAATEI